MLSTIFSTIYVFLNLATESFGNTEQSRADSETIAVSPVFT